MSTQTPDPAKSANSVPRTEDSIPITFKRPTNQGNCPDRSFRRRRITRWVAWTTERGGRLNAGESNQEPTYKSDRLLDNGPR